MPAESEAQRRFMGAELGRLRSGEETETGMSESQLEDFARKKKRKHKRSTRRKKRRSRKSGRRKR
jgi:hypothetical protein